MGLKSLAHCQAVVVNVHLCKRPKQTIHADRATPVSSVDQWKPDINQSQCLWAELPYELLAGTELDLASQAFLDDYMFTNKTSAS